MVQVNALGDACPIPVIKTLHALQDLNGAGTVQTLVDNEIAVQNLNPPCGEQGLLDHDRKALGQGVLRDDHD